MAGMNLPRNPNDWTGEPRDELEHRVAVKAEQRGESPERPGVETWRLAVESVRNAWRER
jgi:hypothetical protein